MLDVREGAARVILHRAIAELRERVQNARAHEPAYTPER